MDHLVELLFHMTGLAVAAEVSHEGCRSNDHIGNAAFASAVIGPVVAGKALHQKAGKLGLTAHEDTFPRDKNILQDCQALAAHDAVLGVALIHSPLAFTIVIGLAAKYM